MKTAELANLLSIPELPSYLEHVDRLLVDSVSNATSSIKHPAQRLIKGGGKRLRPFLVIAAAKSQDAEINESVLRACAAIELVHLGTIVHDDIIDNAEIRWGVPTINSKEGVNQAIVVGDYLLALSAHFAISINNNVANAIAVATMAVCDGQSQETADEYKSDRSIESYNSVISKKTAALTSAACRVGGLCGGLTDSQIGVLARYGELFGMSFQLVDDLLDFLSTSEAMGKPVGNDLKEGVYTLPILLALEGKHSERIKSWLGKDPRIKPKRSEIVDTLVEAGAIEATLAEVRRHNNIAAKTIKGTGNNKVTEGLAKLPDVYLDWALKKCSALVRENK